MVVPVTAPLQLEKVYPNAGMASRVTVEYREILETEGEEVTAKPLSLTVPLLSGLTFTVSQGSFQAAFASAVKRVTVCNNKIKATRPHG